jgi:methionyl-tRNA formyltransferase
VIIDATHARRPWRLALTQALPLPAPVEWIGWWLYTPLPTCLEWNRQRERQVPEAVIQEMAAALADPHFGPSRAEGFAALCAVVPTHHDDLEPLLAAELAALDRRIRAYHPHPGTWLKVGEGRYHIPKAQVHPETLPLSPGETKVERRRLFLGTGMGTLEVLEIQAPGKKAMPTSAFLNGHACPPRFE